MLTLAALLLLPTYSVLAGSDTTIRISISPTGGPPNTNIAVTGEGAEVGIPVQVKIVTDGDTGAGALSVVQVDPDSNGAFAVTIAVPSDVPDGEYAIRAEQRSADAQGAVLQYYWVTFRVGTGTGTVLPVGGGPGSSLTITEALAALLIGLTVFQGTRMALKR